MGRLALRGSTEHQQEVLKVLYALYPKIELKYANLIIHDTYYYFEYDNYLTSLHHTAINECQVPIHCMTLEEFKSKFPYNVGDKVTCIESGNKCVVIEMYWEPSVTKVIYVVKSLNTGDEIICEAQNIEYTNTDVLDCRHYIEKVELCISDNQEIVEKDGKYFVVRKSKYPTTYDECKNILNIKEECFTVNDKAYNKLDVLSKLIICRDAYWKVDDYWKPDWTNEVGKYVICKVGDEINLGHSTKSHFLLAFKTEEARNKFYEHFKELIKLWQKYI